MSGTAAHHQGTRRRWIRMVLVSAGVLLIAAGAIGLGVGTWLRVQLGRSLPDTSGERRLPGLSAAVTVARDDRGVPLVTGASRADVARALGFVHAQERFFQMDLSRRRAAGELAELVGPAALPIDRSARLHRMRTRATRIVAATEYSDRALLEAYTGGVNAGLAAFAAPPPEYVLLRADPRPWSPEDSVLVAASMFFSLQDANATLESRATLMHETFPAPLADFLMSTASEWDTPIEGDRLPAPSVPGPEVFDLRNAVPHPEAARHRGHPATQPVGDPLARAITASMAPPIDDAARGSNNWAVSGRLTADGRAIVADDMHLGIGVPNTWYFASLAWTETGASHRVTGVTLPGVPSVVVGSNGMVAWAFTNTTADWTDLVVVETVPGEPTKYRTPDGPRAFEVVAERIAVKGGPDEWLQVRETMWGPLRSPDHAGRVFAISWVAHHQEALNMRFPAVERARTLAEMLDVANMSGIPAQNFVVVDREGHIAWTVAGRIPRREGFDGRLPVSWADGTRGWRGWYAADDYPRVIDPPSGIIVTANNRIASGRGLAMLGDGGFDPGARARQIHDGLVSLRQPRERDMLAVQLDDRALFMDRWRSVALGALHDGAVVASPPRREFRRLLVDGWTGRASVDSVGYRLVRQFRGTVMELAMAPFAEPLRALDPDHLFTPVRAQEGAIWALLQVKPRHLLAPEYRDWDALLLEAVDRSIAALTEGQRALAERTWGEANTSLVQHPLSRAVPSLARWLDVPPHALPGDSHMPRVQGTTFGASERLAVSPGREEDGYFHMPAGQSGHLLSPHYADGHAAWANGEPRPFLPGRAASTLTLTP